MNDLAIIVAALPGILAGVAAIILAAAAYRWAGRKHPRAPGPIIGLHLTKGE